MGKKRHATGAQAAARAPWVEGRVLHFVRHGKYELASGQLTALGRDQARRIVRMLGALPIDSIVSSTMPRAVETSELLASALGLRLSRPEPLLREVLPCAVPGVTIPLAKRAEGSARIAEILRRHFKPSSRTRHEVLVCHGNLIRALVQRVVSGKPNGFHKLMIHHGAVTSFVITKQHVKLLSHNALDHLPLAMRMTD